MESSLYQVFLFSVLWLILWLPLGALLAFLLKWKPFRPLSPLEKLPLVLSLYAIAPLILAKLLSRFKLSWVDIGISLENLLSGSFFLGLLISVASIVGLFTFFWGMGWVHRQTLPDPEHKNVTQDMTQEGLSSSSNASSPNALILIPSLLVLGILIGGVEELVFRGFLTGRLCEGLSLGAAGAIASLIFALLHLVWEGKDNIPQLPGLWVMGMVLTIAWWVDEQAIALAWGLHAGWVWSVATIDALAIIQYSDAVPSWVTGIDQKPLAGVMGVVALGITGLGIALLR